MTMDEHRIEVAGELLRSLAAAQRNAALYPLGHPQRLAQGASLQAHAQRLRGAVDGETSLFVDRGGFYLGSTLLPRASLAYNGLAAAAQEAGITSVTITDEADASSFDALVEVLAHAAPLRRDLGGLHCNTVRPLVRDEQPWEARLTDLRGAYAHAITVLRRASEQARQRRPLDLADAVAVVDRLATAIARDPGDALLLSVMRSDDEYTAFHMVNVSLLSIALGQAIGLRPDQVQVLGLGALLHDIGTVHVPAEILASTGRLDAEQWRLVQRHPVDGAGMLLSTGPGLYHPAAAILLEHHIGVDGSGYPALQGHRPSAASRMVAVADCFDAMTSRRSYREPVTRAEAIRLLGVAAGHGLDARAVAAFGTMVGRFPVGSLVRLSTGEAGIVTGARRDDRPRVLILLDATDTPVPIEERVLSEASATGVSVVASLDPDDHGIDLPGFVAAGRLPTRAPAGAGDVGHEPSQAERAPDGDAHAHPSHPTPLGRLDPDVSPPIEGPA